MTATTTDMNFCEDRMVLIRANIARIEAHAPTTVSGELLRAERLEVLRKVLDSELDTWSTIHGHTPA